MGGPTGPTTAEEGMSHGGVPPPRPPPEGGVCRKNLYEVGGWLAENPHQHTRRDFPTATLFFFFFFRRYADMV